MNRPHRNWAKLLSVPLLLSWLAAGAPAASTETLQRSFEISDIERTRRVTAHIFVPEGLTGTASVLVVMHGNGRNAKSYHRVWKPLAAANGVVLVTPEFSKNDWPRSRHYHHGNVLTSRKATKPRHLWSFSAMERAVDIAAAQAGVSARKFYLYGHSAGAQFAHRYVMVTGGARLIRAVAANAGWYSWPSNTKSYPYGVAPVENHRWRWESVFQTDLTILLGTDDNDPQAKALRRSAKVMFQGEHRLARGQRFFQAARAFAATVGSPFHWRLATVPDAGHSNRDMAAAAARILFAK